MASVANLEPFSAASLIVQFHIVAALTSAVLIIIQFAGLKSGVRHKAVGWICVVTMAATAISSFWISGLRNGNFSPIHVLSIITLISLPVAVIARRRGNIRQHKWNMIGAGTGLLVAGLFTLLPGRIMHQIVFGP